MIRIRPELVFDNANVLTMAAAQPRAKALAIGDGRIVAVGSSSEVRAAAPRAQHVDLAGRTVLPGFIDAHAHVSQVGHELQKVNLAPCRSIADVLRAVGERARSTPKGEWVEGSAMWHETALAEKRFPTRRELDAAAPDHPVYLPRGTRFFAVCNSLALQLAGIDEHTPEPDGGQFNRDPVSGELTGLLLQRPAFALVQRLLPKPDASAKRRAIQHGQKLFSRAGVTSVVDPALLPDAQRAYVELWAEGAFTLRTNMTTILDMSVPLSLSREELLAKVDALGPSSGFGDETLRLGQLKLFVDGFVETAWLHDGYANDPTFHGVQAVPRDTLIEAVCLANRNGWQVGVHCVGDAAVDLALDALEAADRERPISGRRWSLMHAVFASPSAMERARKLGVVISAQQLLVYAFAPTMRACWGEARMQHASPHRTWLDRGLVVAAGSDVVPFEPLLGIQSLVTRETLAAGIVGPGERVSRTEALHMYTVAGAYLTHEEQLKGSLEVGKLADLVILDGDPLTCPQTEIKNIPIVATLLGSQVTYGALP
ncbi:MAG TPA: amidohydrolase [Chloroflexota bacterium]